MELHPQIIQKDGKTEYVVLPWQEFVEIQDRLEDLEDLRDLRDAKARRKDEKNVSLDQAIKELEL